MNIDDQRLLEELELKFKHSRHLMRYLESSPEFGNYFKSAEEFNSMADKFFNVTREELAALSMLGYPINGRIFFDHEILARIIQILPQFMLSLIKEGNSLLFTIFQFQTIRPHRDIIIEPSNIRQISENIFYIWKAISDIETSDILEDEKKAQLSQLPPILRFKQLHYDLMACFQMNLMSQFMYMDARGINIETNDNPTVYPDREKRELMCEVVGYLALPIKIGDQILLDDGGLFDLRATLHKKINEAGFIQNVYTAIEKRAVLPQLASGIQKMEQIDGIESLFQLNGDFWEIKYAGETAHINNSKGLQYIQMLIAKATEPIRADVLVTAKDKPEVADGLIIPEDEYKSIKQGRDSEESYETRTQDYANEVRDSKPQADYQVYRGALSSLEAELDSYPIDSDEYFDTETRIKDLKKVISKTFNVRGEERPSFDDGDKARQAVFKAVDRAKDKILDYMPELHAHLDKYLVTGYKCIYDPPPSELPEWQL